MGSQRVGHDWVTELNWTEYLLICVTKPRKRKEWLWSQDNRVQGLTSVLSCFCFSPSCLFQALDLLYWKKVLLQADLAPCLWPERKRAPFITSFSWGKKPKKRLWLAKSLSHAHDGRLDYWGQGGGTITRAGVGCKVLSRQKQQPQQRQKVSLMTMTE